MADSLLRDAIADARQVKATAMANAKLALEEAFKPHLASMLAAKLRNEVEENGPGTDGDPYGEEKLDDIEETVNPSSSDIGTGDNKEPSSDADSSSNVPNPKQEVDAFGKGNTHPSPAEGSNSPQSIGGSDPAPHGSDAHPEKLRSESFGMGEEENDEFNLEPDGEEGEEGGEEEFGGEPEMGAGEFGQEAPPIGMSAVPGQGVPMGVPGAANALPGMELPGQGFPAMGMQGMQGEPDGDEGDLDLDSIIRELEQDVLGMEETVPMEEGEANSDRGGQESHDMAQPFGKGTVDAKPVNEEKEEDEDEDEDEEDLEEILREIELEETDDGQRGARPNGFGNENPATTALRAENVELKRSLKEHRDVVRFLKDRITEINMLNAKLLFTNKLFKEYSLNPGQKMHVVETFDRATTLREVKLIFTTLAETYAGSTTKKGGKSVKQITEGLASRSVGSSTKPKSTQPLNEAIVDPQVERFKKLAGLLKS